MRADLAALVGDCHKALRRVEEGTRWAYSAGFYPGRRWVGEPPGREMRVGGSRETDDDQVPGPTHDVGMGDYEARRAVSNVTRKLSEASGFVWSASAVVGAANRLREVPKGTTLRSSAPLSTILSAITQVQAQLDVVGVAEHSILNDQAANHVGKLLHKALSRLDSAAAGLDRWADNVKPSRQLPVAMCRTCELRPRPLDAKGHLAGPECSTCASWRARHDGKTRPQTEDMVRDEKGKWVRPEVAAKTRRDAAGVGFGWS